MMNSTIEYWLNYRKNVKYNQNLAEFCNVTILFRKRRGLGQMIKNYLMIINGNK